VASKGRPATGGGGHGDEYEDEVSSLEPLYSMLDGNVIPNSPLVVQEIDHLTGKSPINCSPAGLEAQMLT
jgi:hypothetical protein